MGDVVTVPDRYGLGPIKVKAIADGKVDMIADVTGDGYSISGCSGGGAVSSAGGGGVEFKCSEGPAATLNNAMSLKVVAIHGASAVLSIKPAG